MIYGWTTGRIEANGRQEKIVTQNWSVMYFLLCNKKSWFDFADELKIGDVRYKTFDPNNN